MKRPRENESISDQDLRHVFDKVDINRDERVNRRVSKGVGESYLLCFCAFNVQELRMACKFLCKQFGIDIKKVNVCLFLGKLIN